VALGAEHVEAARRQRPFLEDLGFDDNLFFAALALGLVGDVASSRCTRIFTLPPS
jgi:hypothetical protein